MNNFWLNKFREGRLVTYIGEDRELKGRTGKIVKSYGGFVDVQFELPSMYAPYKKVVTVTKVELELS